MPVATHSQLKPALSTVNRPRRRGEVSRSTAAWSPPNPGSSKFAIVQALALPPVRLPVEAQFAVDLLAVLAERPDSFNRLRLTGDLRETMRLKPVVGHAADRNAVDDSAGEPLFVYIGGRPAPKPATISGASESLH